MNKLIPTIIGALIISFFLMWHLATKNPNPTSHEQTIIVGTNAEYKPFSFMENDTITGFDIDLMKEISVRLGKNIELRDMPFESLIPALQAGTIHIIAGGLTPTPERAQRILFSKPYITGDPLVIVSPSHKPIENLEQLKNAKQMNIAVNEGYTADYFVSNYYKSDTQAPNIIRFATPLEAFMAMQSGRVEVVIASASTAKPYIEHYQSTRSLIPGTDKQYSLTTATIANTSDEYALAISKKYPDLLVSIQNALDEITQDGTLDGLKKKWKLI